MNKSIYNIYVRSKGWSGKSGDWNRVREFEINYQKFINNFKNLSVIDVGCGDGLFLDYLRNKGFSNIFGIDIIKECIKICTQKKHKSQCTDAIEYFKFCKTKYSLVVINDVLEHLSKTEAVDLLKYIRECLNEDGRIIARVPNASYLLSNTLRYTDYTHAMMFDVKSLSYLFRLSKYKVVFTDNFIYIAKTWIRGLLRKIIINLYGLVCFVLQGEHVSTEANIFIVVNK
jgi:2-polyprenyl-3-methyl-5-hydroxy-6-metoxy-1,4-benzoquinol methylase